MTGSREAGWRAALRALAEVEERLGADMRTFVRGIARDDEDFELALALPLIPEPPSAGVIYNPRRRTEGFGGRVRDALQAHGLSADACEPALRLAAGRLSLVLALAWTADAPPAATVYFEGMGRLLPGGRREIAAALGIAAIPDHPGAPFAYAVDIGPAGVTARKEYRWHNDADEALAALAVHAGPGAVRAARRLLEPEHGPTWGYLVQRRLTAGGTMKLYRCFPYLGTDPLCAARETVGRALAGDDALFRRVAAALPAGGLRPTNLGITWAPGAPEPLGGTAYWELFRPSRSEPYSAS